MKVVINIYLEMRRPSLLQTPRNTLLIIWPLLMAVLKAIKYNSSTAVLLLTQTIKWVKRSEYTTIEKRQ